MTKEIRENKNDQNVFSKGCLVNFRASKWGATSRLTSDKMEKINKEFGLETDDNVLRAMQNIITQKDKVRLDDLNQIRNNCKSHIRNNSIPYPEENLFFIPKERIEVVNDYLEDMKKLYFEIVEEIISKVDQMETDFATQYPEIYQPGKYPDQYKLRSKFDFKWNFRVFSVPDKELSVLSPSMYKNEISKFKDEVQEMKRMTLQTVSSELMKRVEALGKQCESNTINQGTINGINTFLDKFDSLFANFVDQKEISKTIEDVKMYMQGTDAEMLRADVDFANLVQKKMNKVVDELENIEDVKLKRSIEI